SRAPASWASSALAAMSPIENPKVIFNSGGSDAIDVACKLARRYWQAVGETERTVIVSRDTSYHGLHAFGTAIAGLEPNREGYGTESLVPDTVRVSANDPARLEEQILAIGPQRIAAFVAEPVIGAGGVIGPADGYFETVQRLAKEHGFLFIADEVITGFGRTGKMFASERYSLDPDIHTMAKGLTSGYAPLGGIQIAERVWEPFFTGGEEAPAFRHGVTYSGHATACAVAHANLDVLEREDLVDRAGKLEDVLATELDTLVGVDGIAEVRSRAGFLGAVKFTEDLVSETIVRRAAERGVILRALPDNALQISPPFVAEPEDLALTVSAIRESVAEG
ncbi:aminotransferase class III-fold pyridoxal phosphate-dependent enzyme, partial [uncultured Brevibacterium sp.]|uniref:aminotransferase family protein n=1 Tax=uncultured Brevibacterium sp. TaxID=189678 RepID=UPI0025F6C821